MAHASLEEETVLPESVPSISELVAGLRFEYKVRAEKDNNYGDFPNKNRRFQFQTNGSWLIAAAIIETASVGYPTQFTVFEDDDSEPLIDITGTILPRETNPGLDPAQYGTHIIQEGFATRLGDPSLIEVHAQDINPKENLAFLIPARNIAPGSLRILGYPNPVGAPNPQ